ncbi:hypothetical protein [Luteimonas huabeiensis]|uniref:hypothetical protein n=1 Tax=Luteimonas huabeiensis TaxID=1244513 RepID=UPI0004663C2A|nr:hypothetical protein [Luteimonas huabeiensis]
MQTARTIALFACLALAASLASAAERASRTVAGASVYAYDAPTDQAEVFRTLRRLVAEDANAGTHRQIYVVTGTHGNPDGTVTGDCAEIRFKAEDLDSARITRSHIHIRDYHLTAPNRWRELDERGPNAVIVLAWCYSHQWTRNPGPDGNDGKLTMR